MLRRKAHLIAVKHNIEVAHRLFLLPGKCENIHGHSMWIELEIEGELNEGGILNGIEYGDLKKGFRGYLDSTYDHHLLLNQDDPFAQQMFTLENARPAAWKVGTDSPEPIEDNVTAWEVPASSLTLPGLRKCPGDPTTENIASWVLYDMKTMFEAGGMMDDISTLYVEVWETSVNMASAYEEYE